MSVTNTNRMASTHADLTNGELRQVVRALADMMLTANPELTVRGLAWAVSDRLEQDGVASEADRGLVLEMVEEWDCE